MISFTAEPVAVNFIDSLPFASLIDVVILGVVKAGLVSVLFVNVCVAPSSTTTQLKSGNTTTLSAVGSRAANLVS